ncbi:FAD-dependent oxidoreductase [Sphingobium sp. AN641]|uniref:FAD-dependent oxidoreductase n=1 Tax=Sphingobium sp. AN641 TaxID=3133443 RepID=UPI0030BF2A46
MASTTSIPVWRQVGASPFPDAERVRLETVIVGAGPVGLTLALALGRLGRRVTVLSRLDFVPAGSKAICFSKRTLDIWDRLGVGADMLAGGVVWSLGKVFWGDREEPVYEFDMLPVKDQKMPGFINLQQYHAEEVLLSALSKLENVEIRWGHEVIGIDPRADGADLKVSAAGREYAIEADWVAACDGFRSTIRSLLGLAFEGRVFEDNFLIADVKVKVPRPTERWFWFDPPFNPGRSALMHKQPDDVWRLDFQLGWDIDREACVKPENVAPFVRGLLGEGVEFTPEWYSVYTFQCRRMARFVHGRVIFAGDSAHVVSPFGARGCNGGVADAENLAWKLDLVLSGAASAALLESYNDEAITAADENIRCSSRSTDFMTPKSEVGHAFRDAVLELAHDHSFARPFVNSGRLSTPVSYPDSVLNTADGDGERWRGPAPGCPPLDGPLGSGWLLERVGNGFVVLANGWRGAAPCGATVLDVAETDEVPDLLIERWDLTPGSAYLIRPDQYVAARWRKPSAEEVDRAILRAKGRQS